MICLRIEFLAGRYQATPWEHHVNEGLVEWPPSPWRLVRALLATGYTKLGWAAGAPPPTACSLIEKLSAVLPSYSLPSVTMAHSRHYMPLGELDKASGEPRTTKVFDTFAYVWSHGEGSQDAPVAWVWWDAELSQAEHALLHQLAGNLGYLGRAESWVAATAHDALPAQLTPNAWPAEEPNDESARTTQVMAPLTPSEYIAWRNAAFEGAVMAASSSGKKPSAKQRSELVARFPPGVVDALRTDTATLQKQGWSRAPGARWVSYRLEEPALARTPSRRAARRDNETHFCLYAITSDTERGTVRPVLARALEIGGRVHRTLIQRADKNQGSIPAELLGCDAAGPLKGHRHSHYLPFDLDADGRLDHILVWCPDGFSRQGVIELERLSRLRDPKTESHLFLTLAAQGDQALMERELGQLVVAQSACVWESVTPFVCPRFAKPRGKNTVEGQVLAELSARGHAAPSKLELWSDERVQRSHFYRFDRIRERRRPPFATPFGVTLTFDAPLRGPLSLGYGSHFGLGLFRARTGTEA